LKVEIKCYIWIQDFSFEGAQEVTKRSLDTLGFDYIDLMLLHEPMVDYIGAWRGLEKLYKEGKIKSIGIATCYPHILVDICETVHIKPIINQIEMRPFFQQR
jgi:Aldo/keto reductases, related to diketogulonate reductase